MKIRGSLVFEHLKIRALDLFGIWDFAFGTYFDSNHP